MQMLVKLDKYTNVKAEKCLKYFVKSVFYFFIFKLRPWNGTRTHNQLACKPTLAHIGKLASMAKWFSLPL